MSAPRGEVGAADVLRAWHALGGDDATHQAVAALLGMRVRPRAAGPEDVAPPTRPHDPDLSTPEVVRRISRSPVQAAGPAPRRAERDRAAGRTPWRRRLRPSGRDLPAGDAPVVRPLPVERPTPPAPALQPLFAPHLVAAVVEAAVGTDAQDGPVDIAALVEVVAAHRPVTALPRAARRSLFRGVQVLVDRHESMMLFDGDVRALVAAVRRTVGPGAVQQLAFSGSPVRCAGTGPAGRWHAYRPPAPGTPVLVLTDLGLGRTPGQPETSTPQEWDELADVLARRGSPTTVLVPFPRDRWPAGFPQHLALVQWDRSTTVAAVLRAGEHRDRR